MNMKRRIALCLLFALMLTGCGKKEVIETGDLSTPTTVPATTAATTVPAETTEVTEPTVPETEPVVVYRNPLTGQVLEEPYTGRPVALSIGNTQDALPQLGISKADMLYEIETEGGITRFMPVFTNYAFDEAIGPVRSARTYYNNISTGYGACLAHCGGSVRGINGYYDLTGGKILDWVHINQQQNGKYFYRDQARRSAGYLIEHTMCTTGNKLVQAMEDKGFANDTAYDYGYQFSEDASLTDIGTAAAKLTVHFVGGKNSTFLYDAETGLYTMQQYGGKAVIDGNSNEEITFKNLIVIYAPHSKKHDGYYSRSYYDLMGSGEGFFAVNGQIVPITWSRETLNDPFVYMLEDGTPITFGVGTTYVAVASNKSKTVEAQ